MCLSNKSTPMRGLPRQDCPDSAAPGVLADAPDLNAVATSTSGATTHVNGSATFPEAAGEAKREHDSLCQPQDVSDLGACDWKASLEPSKDSQVKVLQDDGEAEQYEQHEAASSCPGAQRRAEQEQQELVEDPPSKKPSKELQPLEEAMPKPKSLFEEEEERRHARCADAFCPLRLLCVYCDACTSASQELRRAENAEKHGLHDSEAASQGQLRDACEPTRGRALSSFCERDREQHPLCQGELSTSHASLVYQITFAACQLVVCGFVASLRHFGRGNQWSR